MPAAILAGLLVGLGQLLGWQGVDVAAQVYRVDNFRTMGFSLWDFQWYGGHWTLDYSVIYPALASVTGEVLLAIISAILATYAFDRMARAHFGTTPGRAAAVAFSLGTLVTSSIGQMPFLTGEAFGMLACWAASRGRWKTAGVVALASSLSSPLAGMFVAMVAAAWVLACWRTTDRVKRLGRAAILIAAAGGPVVAAAVLLPGGGAMPYPMVDYLFELGVAAAFWLTARWVGQPLVQAAALIWMATATVAVVVPTSLGGNIGRMEDVLAFPMAVALLWTSWRIVLPLITWPLILAQWGPAWGALTSSSAQPSTHQTFFAPLDAALTRMASTGPKGRVEVVPTAYHWEAAYVPGVMPLARGGERQLDVSDNPIFYHDGALTPDTYRQWLIDNGVRYVALPSAPLDMAAKSEGALVASGTVPGLKLVWHSAEWRLYSVSGSSGIVSSPAQLVSTVDNRVVVDSPTAGTVLIRVHTSPYWRIGEGEGCIVPADKTAENNEAWITVDVPQPEQFSLEMSLFGSHDQCSAPTLNATPSLVQRPGHAALTGPAAASGSTGPSKRRGTSSGPATA